MSAELKILAVNAVFLGYAYAWAYPRLPRKTAVSIMWRDGVLMCAALMIGAYLFARTDPDFNLIIATTNWLIFQVITYAIMQTPLFAWFAHKHRDIF
jgi:hypothetical protein